MCWSSPSGQNKMEQQTPISPKSRMKPRRSQNAPFSHPWFGGWGRGQIFIYFVKDCNSRWVFKKTIDIKIASNFKGSMSPMTLSSIPTLPMTQRGLWKGESCCWSMVSSGGQIKPELCLGGTPFCKLYKYVPPHWVGFLIWRRVYTLPILAWNRVWFLRELQECVPWISEVFCDMCRGALFRRQQADICSAEGQRNQHRRPQMKSLWHPG